MARTPGFSLTAILSLALGIGATVSVFSVIYSAILNAWPYAGFDRVCQINTISRTGDEGGPGFTGPQVRQLRQTSAVEDVVAVNRWNLIITGSDVPEDLAGRLFYGKWFPVFRHDADSRRYFDSSDAPDLQDPQPVAVLSSTSGGGTSTAIQRLSAKISSSSIRTTPFWESCRPVLPGWMAMSTCRSRCRKPGCNLQHSPQAQARRPPEAAAAEFSSPARTIR